MRDGLSVAQRNARGASMNRFIFENCPLGPLWSAILSGFAAVDWWGNVYLTKLGEAYLAERS
jgi:hypothetical protein